MEKYREIKFEIVFKDGRRAAYKANSKTDFVLKIAALKKWHGPVFRLVRDSIKFSNVIQLRNKHHTVVIIKGAA